MSRRHPAIRGEIFVFIRSDSPNPVRRLVLATQLNLRLCLLVLFAIPPLCGVAKAQHTEVVLRSFASGANGKQPLGSVAFDGSGNMYGTTYEGGASSRGTVWEISSAGVFSTLRSCTTSDGGFSQGGITFDSSGNLYITGYTCSSDFPVTTGSFQTTWPAGFTVF